MPFRSQAQWRWAFANKKPWAREWANETPQRLSQLPAYTRKAATTGNFSARAGERIGGNQCRDENGNFANCEEVQGGVDFDPEAAIANPTSSMRNFQYATEYAKIIENERKKILRQQVREQLGVATPKKVGGTLSASERKRQQREEQKRNEMEMHTAAGPGGRLGTALSAFADPDNPQMLPNLLAAQLEEAGLVISSQFGQPYISPAGRAYLSAARSGDVFAAQEAMMRAREDFLNRQEQQIQREEAEARRQQAEMEQAIIESIEGTPFERRLFLAQKRRDDMMKYGQPKPSRAAKKPAQSGSNTYGSGNVIAGSPKSTVKSAKEMDDSDMSHYPPENVLRAMIVGMDFAKFMNINTPVLNVAHKAIAGEPFSYDDMRRLKEFHDVLGDRTDIASRETPTPAWVEYQIVGGMYGHHWIDQVLGEYERRMSRYKADSNKPRVASLSASVEAIRGLDLQHYFKRGGSPSMIALARKIANRKEISEDEIRSMHSYLQRHTGDRKDDWANPSDPSVAYINWQLHGGDAGLSWSSDEIDSMKLKREKPSTVKERFTTDERQRLSDDDFVLSDERKFPVTTAEGVRDAIHSWGRYRGTTSFDTFKKKLIDLAERKGLTNALPDEWMSERKKEINFSPPAGVRSAAKRGLELRSKFNRGGTSVGIARARDLSNGKNMSPQTIRRMHSFFARHAVDKRPGWSDPSKPSNGYIAHLLWGGDAGRAWAAKVDRQLDAREKRKEFQTYKHGNHDQMNHGNRGGGGGGGGGAIGSMSGPKSPLANVDFVDAVKKRLDGKLPQKPRSSSTSSSMPGQENSRGVNQNNRSGYDNSRNVIGLDSFRKDPYVDLGPMTEVLDRFIRGEGPSPWAKPSRSRRSDSPNNRSGGGILGGISRLAQRLTGSRGNQSRSQGAISSEGFFDDYINRMSPSARQNNIPQGSTSSGRPNTSGIVGPGYAPPPGARTSIPGLPSIDTSKFIDDPRLEYTRDSNTFGGSGKSLKSAKKWRRMGRLQSMRLRDNRNADVLAAVQQGERYKGKNKPNNPSLWRQAVAQAKKKYRVYPSAYANGYASSWYKKRGGTWRTEKDLREWFDEQWVDLSRPKKGGGYEPCGRKTDGMSESEYRKKYPKCVPASRASRMSDDEKRSAIRRKRDDGLPKGGKPSMVSTITKP